MSTTITDLSGRLVDNGRYQLLQQLGSGSYGVVYQALDLAAPVESSASPPLRAIKITSKEGLDKKHAIHLTREFTIHHTMGNHPNIVTLIHGFEDREYAYYVLDYCPGGDLFGKACREAVYWRNDALLKKVFLQIVDAIETCHRRGISHRDLKPENILSNEDGSVAYVTDFGLSSNQPTASGHGCGSSPYMSPECIGTDTHKRPYNNALSDVWSLGVTLITLAVGRFPWARAISSDPHYSQYLLDPNYIRSVLPISKGLNNIITRMLCLQPEKRITLPELRSAIINLDTFFMSKREVMFSGHFVQQVSEFMTRRARQSPALERVGGGRRVNPKLAKNKFRIQRVGSRGQLEDVDMGWGIPSNVGVILRGACSSSPTLCVPAPPPPTLAPKPIRPASFIGSVDSSESLSLPEFFGTSEAVETSPPVTPETFAVIPDVEVPDLEADMGMVIMSEAEEVKIC